MILKTPGGRYRLKVKFRGVIVADRTFDRRIEAVQWETEQKRRLPQGDFVPPKAGRCTVKGVADEYREARLEQVSVRSWESDESALRVHIVPAFGRLPVDSISPVQIEKFLSALAARRSVRTAARVRTTLRGVFAYAVRTRRIRHSPAERVPLPRPDSRTGKVVEFEPFPLELRGLRVRDYVAVPYPSLTVKRSLPQSARTGRVIERSTTKSGRTRVIPLSELVQPVIAVWAQGKDPEDLLFPAKEGGYLHTQNWRRMVRWDTTGLGRRPHDLRHTAASLWIAAGVDIKTVSAWLGHSTAKLTLDTYGHLMGTDADRAAIDRVNRSQAGGAATIRYQSERAAEHALPGVLGGATGGASGAHEDPALPVDELARRRASR